MVCFRPACGHSVVSCMAVELLWKFTCQFSWTKYQPRKRYKYHRSHFDTTDIFPEIAQSIGMQGGICRRGQGECFPMVKGKSILPQFFLNFSSYFRFILHCFLPQISPCRHVSAFLFESIFWDQSGWNLYVLGRISTTDSQSAVDARDQKYELWQKMNNFQDFHKKQYPHLTIQFEIQIKYETITQHRNTNQNLTHV